MPLISEKFHEEKLKKLGINIKTSYIVENNILEMNTNSNHNDNVVKGLRCKKQYYINNKLKHEEFKFDTRIEYTFLSSKEEDKDYSCPNCGMHSKLKDFLDGCPYCGTCFNIDYVDKDMGSKYYYDRVLRNPTYRLVTALVDIIISLLLSFLFIRYTSRTFNSYDISKIFIYGMILALILYYFFYIIDAYIVLEPIKRYKDRENQKQIEFFDRTKIDKKEFFNNLNYEIANKYYNNSDIIDYDILDFDSYNEFMKNDSLYILVKAYVRIVSFKNDKFISKYITDTYLLKRVNDSIELKDNVNVISCHNCGASIDITKKECDYCHSKVKYFQKWILEK